MKRKTQPPLPPADAADLLPPSSLPAARPPKAKQAERDSIEKTIDYVHTPVIGKAKIETLLPPGAEAEPAPPPLDIGIPISTLRAATPAREAPLIVSDRRQTQSPGLSPEEKAQRRFWKNAIVFGFFVVVLMAVCYLLAR